MAITLTKALASDIAGFEPCVLAGSTTRDSVRADGTLIQKTITGYGSGIGGRLKMSFASGGYDFDIRDTVIISGATGLNEQYNGRHEVYTLSPTSLTMTTLWNGGTAPAVGTVVRSNDSLLVRADVYKDITLLGSVFANSNSRMFELDVAKTIQTGFSSIFSLTAGDVATTGAAFAYKVKIYEQWQGKNFETLDEENSTREQSGLAHRTTSVATTISGYSLLNVDFTASGNLLIHFMTHKTNNVSVVFTPNIGVVTTVATTIAKKHGAACYAIPAGVKSVTVAVIWFNGSENEYIKDRLSIKVPQQACNKRLYFLNRLGGYASIEFPTVQKFTETEKIDRYAVKSYDVVILESVGEARASAEYFRDITDSPEFYDENGVAVLVETSEVQYYANDEIRIQIKLKNEQYLIN